MEVHHHSNHGKKKWTEYIWEFLMLFLAVFCGFLAENQREHYVEKQRAKEYAYQMIEDLAHDTVDMAQFARIIQAYNQGFDTVNALFDQVPPVSNKILLKAILPQRSTYPIQLSATTFNQMKSSGNIRYFRKKELAKAVSDYYDRQHSFLNGAINYANDFFSTEIQPFLLNHFDYSQSDYFTDTLKVENPTYLDRSPRTDILLRNRLIIYNSLLKWNIDYSIKFVQGKATKLIEMLKNEYHIK
jgi:hypothetical protein